jgi:hypothetical protein
MSEPRCSCTTVKGDSYYCPYHGGNGSWAALLSANVRALQNCWDPDIARQVIAARERLPDTHGLARKIDRTLAEVESIRN